MKRQVKPIFFQTAMVEAILNGTKTQTRRKIKPQIQVSERGWKWAGPRPKAIRNSGAMSCWGKNVSPDDSSNFILRGSGKYREGDIMWVRETWQITDFLHPSDENYGYIYKASENGKVWAANTEEWRWKPSIFMPKNACRLFLEVTNVRVERLTNISKEDAIAEGIKKRHSNVFGETWDDYTYDYDPNQSPNFKNPVSSFRSLWESIHGIGSWSRKEWVFVYNFKRVDKPEEWHES